MTLVSTRPETKSAPFSKDGDRLDASIHVTIRDCSLGSILVAATEKGLCAILIGDEPVALERDLRDLFPKTQLM